jgi:hypothetical protein
MSKIQVIDKYNNSRDHRYAVNVSEVAAAIVADADALAAIVAAIVADEDLVQDIADAIAALPE